MITFFIIIGILIVINFLLLKFSCNKITEPEPGEE